MNIEIYKELCKVKYRFLKELIQEIGGLNFQVSGISMEPTYYSGEILTIKESKKLEINDVALFYDDNYDLVLHRIINFKENLIILKGDNADTNDVVELEQIIGIVSDYIEKDVSLVKKFNFKNYNFIFKIKDSLLQGIDLIIAS